MGVDGSGEAPSLRQCLVVTEHLSHYRVGVYRELDSSDGWSFTFAGADQVRRFDTCDTTRFCPEPTPDQELLGRESVADPTPSCLAFSDAQLSVSHFRWERGLRHNLGGGSDSAT